MIIVVQVNAYLHASAALRLSNTVFSWNRLKGIAPAVLAEMVISAIHCVKTSGLWYKLFVDVLMVIASHAVVCCEIFRLASYLFVAVLLNLKTMGQLLLWCFTTYVLWKCNGVFFHSKMPYIVYTTQHNNRESD